MDMSILVFHKSKIYFSGAKNPLLIVRTSEWNERIGLNKVTKVDESNTAVEEVSTDAHAYSFEVIKGSSFPIGSTQFKDRKVFTTHEIDANKGDKLFMYSDGFQDQFGGPNNMKFMSGKFRKLLINYAHLPMNEQLEVLNSTYYDWKGKGKQTDDVLIIGVEV
jgi:serine phosphatase RsbU (regulator of sigma subunit)